MKTVEFRGRAIHDWSWVYGSLRLRAGIDEAIIEEPSGLGHNIYPKTVGQYIGFRDQKDTGQKIYEGDLISTFNYIWLVGFEETFGAFMFVDCSNTMVGLPVGLDKRDDYKIVGNVFENMELLKG